MDLSEYNGKHDGLQPSEQARQDTNVLEASEQAGNSVTPLKEICGG